VKVLAGRFNFQISLFAGNQDPQILHLTQYVIEPHKCTCQMTCKSVQHLKQVMQTDDRIASKKLLALE